MSLRSVVLGALLAALLPARVAAATQERARLGAVVTGHVLDAETSAPVALALVTLEGTRLSALTDSAGLYRLTGVPPGPHVLLVQRLGYARARVPITVPIARALTRDILLASEALEMEDLIVTAEPGGRARGELATASVVDREAIEVQSAASLAQVLELVPGVPLAPPGLDGVQQFALRAVPTSATPAFTLGGPSADELASYGTLILLDGVPLSNNANLQTLGPRGELGVPSSARGGIDLRRIPASTIERVEVIRGMPSARYGDLTQGAILVDTRAGRVEPTLGARFDSRLAEASFLFGRDLGDGRAFSGTADLAHNNVFPGVRDDDSYRLSLQLAHRAEFARDGASPLDEPRLVLDTRIDHFQLRADNPERPEVRPGLASESRDLGLRISERARLALASGLTLGWTAALDYTRRRSFSQSLRLRGAMPFTDRVTEGRATGRYVMGEYLSRVDLEGDEWLIFSRLEAERSGDWLGFDHRLRAGGELRREWNAGAGYQFEILFPPQVTFNGVQGFDRPYRFDAIPPVATSALYVDDRLLRALPGGVALEAQAGLRLDLLHDRTTWFSGVRDAVLQPRLNVQLSPWSWLRLRAGWGRTAKQPRVDQLHPAPQYFDVINVNFFASDSTERLAVLTTFIRDPTNPDLGFARARKAEVGLEVASPGTDLALGVVAFSDRTTGGIGFDSQPEFLLRERFQLTDSIDGNGIPPEIIEPPFQVDTVPVLIDRLANNLVLTSEGIELTASLPELRPIRTRLHVQGAWIRTEFFRKGLDFGALFSEFQLDERIPRAPFWEDPVRTGERAILTYRVIHHQPAVGLVVTATVQHIALERERNVAATDTLAFAGYITRDARLVRVPAEDRTAPEFEDLRQARLGTLTIPEVVPADWLLSLQVAKALPKGGRLSIFAFNALDRLGRIDPSGITRRFFPFVRFGVEASLPLDGLF